MTRTIPAYTIAKLFRKLIVKVHPRIIAAQIKCGALLLKVIAETMPDAGTSELPQLRHHQQPHRCYVVKVVVSQGDTKMTPLSWIPWLLM
jgi:hypothetical protein